MSKYTKWSCQSNFSGCGIETNKSQEGGVLEQMEMGLSLRLPSNLFFESGSAEISNSDVYLYIQRMTAIIKKLPDYVKIDVRGYTDNASLPIGSRYKDNYELFKCHALLL